MKLHYIRVILCILLAVGWCSCEEQKTWERVTEEFVVLYEKGRFEEAEAIARERLDIAKVDRSEEKEKNIRIASAMIDLGNTLFAQNKYKDALKMYQTELDFAKKVFGEQSADIASTLGMIGSCYYKMEDFTAALLMTQQSLDMYKKLMPEHISLIKVPVYVRAMVLLGNIYGETRSFTEAEPYFAEITPLIDSLVLISDPSLINNVLSATIGLATVYINTDGSTERYHQADMLLQKVWKYSEKDPAAYLGVLVSVMETSAQLHEQTGNSQKAEESYLNALRIVREAKGEDNIETASLMGELGRVYTITQQYGKADSLLQESLRKYRELGAEHSLSMARTLQRIGANYRELKEYNKAELALQNAIKLYEDILGASSPILITALESLEEVYYRSGREEEGIAMRNRINRIRGVRETI